MARKGGPVSSKHVAALAGVSAATVSRVARGVDGVSEHLRQRVLQVFAKTGFRHPELNRAPAGHQLLALVVSSITDFDARLMQAIVAGANDAGYSPLVFLYQQLRRDSRQRDHLTLVGGAIFDSAAEAAEYAALAPDLPIVSLQKNTGHAFDEAYPDDYRCGQEIAARIAGTGKVRLALLGELRRSGAYTPLVQGYIDGALLHDLELPFTHLIECGPDPHEAAMVVTGLLHRADKCPQVVLCTSDQVAVGVMDAAARLSLSVPGDLWVIGNGDTAPGRLYALTSISVDFSRLAEFAIQTITRHHGERSGGPLSCAVPNIIQVRSTAALPLEPKSGTDY